MVNTFIFNAKLFVPKQPDLFQFDIKERISIKNIRALLFDGMSYHAGSYPIQNNSEG